MEYQKITNLLGNIPDKAPRFITKKWIEVIMINLEEHTILTSK